MRSKPFLIMAAALLVALAACATRVSFQDPRRNPDDPNQRRVSGLLFKPMGKGPFPAVVLLHTCGGLGPHVTEHWPNYLTGLGYAVMTVDSFGSRGFDRCPIPLSHTDIQLEMTWDAFAALDYLARLPDVDGNRIALMGFSLGAWAINNYLIRNYASLMEIRRSRASGNLGFQAAISFYGACNRSRYAGRLIPHMVIIGDKDNLVNGCRKYGRNRRIKVHVLPDAYHGFDSPGARGQPDNAGNVMLYSASATKKAHELTKAFLAKHLGT